MPGIQDTYKEAERYAKTHKDARDLRYILRCTAPFDNLTAAIAKYRRASMLQSSTQSSYHGLGACWLVSISGYFTFTNKGKEEMYANQNRMRTLRACMLITCSHAHTLPEPYNRSCFTDYLVQLRTSETHTNRALA
eukprot:scaffold290025_cov14-Tisochrysis_lutea.AAC.1